MDPINLKKEMFAAMKEYGGIGISANQLGYDFRAFALLNTSTNNIQERDALCINPEVIEHIEPNVDMWESCLSTPNVTLQVNRPHKIKAKWINEFGKVREETLGGYTARCFLHELDHLDGIMYIDHVSPIKWKEAQAKAEAIKETSNA
jgi:peptide deformylase